MCCCMRKKKKQSCSQSKKFHQLYVSSVHVSRGPCDWNVVPIGCGVTESQVTRYFSTSFARDWSCHLWLDIAVNNSRVFFSLHLLPFFSAENQQLRGSCCCTYTRMAESSQTGKFNSRICARVAESLVVKKKWRPLFLSAMLPPTDIMLQEGESE